MKKSQGVQGKVMAPIKNRDFEPYDYDDGSMASEHEDWQTDIKARMEAVYAQPHEEVDEVHQLEIDKFFGKPEATNVGQKG